MLSVSYLLSISWVFWASLGRRDFDVHLERLVEDGVWGLRSCDVLLRDRARKVFAVSVHRSMISRSIIMILYPSSLGSVQRERKSIPKMGVRAYRIS